MKAVFVTGGKQYTVAEGDVLFIEKLAVEAEQTVKFDQVLAVLDGENSKIGAPVVAGAVVEAKVVKNGKGKNFLPRTSESPDSPSPVTAVTLRQAPTLSVPPSLPLLPWPRPPSMMCAARRPRFGSKRRMPASL